MENVGNPLATGWISTPLDEIEEIHNESVDHLDLSDGSDPIHQKYEHDWWGNCANTFGEEAKQITYANRMGLEIVPMWGKWPLYDMQGKRIADIGGGPVSMLLKTINLGERSTVFDPCQFPDWVYLRYKAHDIMWEIWPAESIQSKPGYKTLFKKYFDEVWIYNVLQHVVDPEEVVGAAKHIAQVVRIFDWIETSPSLGHPHTLHADDLDRWLGGTGTVEQMNENGAVGTAYYGVFKL